MHITWTSRIITQNELSIYITYGWTDGEYLLGLLITLLLCLACPYDKNIGVCFRVAENWSDKIYHSLAYDTKKKDDPFNICAISLNK